MHIKPNLTFWGILVSAMVAAAASIADDELPRRTHDGLQLVPESQVAVAYVKPDADFGGYRRIMLLDAHVAFRKNWLRDHNRSSVPRITNRNVERIKQATAKLSREVFVEELGADGAYR